MRRRPRTLGCAIALTAVSAQAQQTAEPAVAFVNVSVIPMDTERVLGGRTVLVRGERIEAIDSAVRVKIPKGAVVVDGRGKFLLPGLADMHVQLFGDMTNHEYTPDMLLALLASGVTTVRDMHTGGRIRAGAHGSDSFPLTVKKRVAARELLGPRIYTAGDPARGPFASIRESIVALKANGHDFMKLDESWSRERSRYDSAKTLADSLGLRLVGHVPTQLGVQGLIERRWGSIEHLMGYVNHLIDFNGTYEAVGAAREVFGDTALWLQPGATPDPAKLRDIAVATQRAGVWNCPTLGVVQDIAHRKDQSNSARDSLVGARYFEFDLQIVKALHDAGAGLLLGTDVLGVRGLLREKYGLQREMQLLLQAKLTPYQVLEIATRNAARFLGTEATAGTVTVGKAADLVLLDGNPLEDLMRTAGPAGVMIGGHWLSRADFDRLFQAQKDEHERLAEQRRMEQEQRRRERAPARDSTRTAQDAVRAAGDSGSVPKP